MSSIPPGVPSFSPTDLDPEDETGHGKAGGRNATVVRSAPQEVMDALRSHAPTTVPPPPEGAPSLSGLRKASAAFDFSKGPVLLSDEDEAEMLADATKLAPRPGQRVHEAVSKPPPPRSTTQIEASAIDALAQESGDGPTRAEVPPLESASLLQSSQSTHLGAVDRHGLSPSFPIGAAVPTLLSERQVEQRTSHDSNVGISSEQASVTVEAASSQRNRRIGALVFIAMLLMGLLALASRLAGH